MQLENFESAWKQLKCVNGMRPIASNEIVSIIGRAGNSQGSKLQNVILSVVMFVVMTIIVQGG